MLRHRNTGFIAPFLRYDFKQVQERQNPFSCTFFISFIYFCLIINYLMTFNFFDFLNLCLLLIDFFTNLGISCIFFLRHKQLFLVARFLSLKRSGEISL
jgi:hypothetical protein